MYNLSVEKVLKQVGSDKSGLTEQIALDKLKKDGKNELEKVKKQNFFKRFLKQFLNVMVGILLVSAIVSIVFACVKKEYSDLFEAFVILFIVVMNAFIGVIQENKAQACLDDLQKYDTKKVKVIRSNRTIYIDSKELVVGDIVQIEAGNVVCADMRLIDSNNLTADESSLTGESLPIEKNADLVLPEKTPLAERKNMVYSGSMITNGNATCVVVSTGKNTEIGKIANMIFSSKKEMTPLQKSIDKIGKILTYSTLAICFVIFVIEMIVGGSFVDATMTSVALAVAAIPESLPAVITIIMALGVQQLAKRRCIIKHLHAVETLGSCEIICTDKTGTLTLNKMQVVETDCFNSDRSLNKEMLLSMVMCNNTTKKGDVFEGEPTELALFEYAEKQVEFNRSKIIHQIPFSSARKMMSVLASDNGLICYSKGAPEILLKKCKFVKIDGKIVEITPEILEKIKKSNDYMTENALRVMAFAFKKFDKLDNSLDIESDLIFVGLVGMMDRPRPEVKDSIKKCFSAGLTPIMITGDHKKTAFAIAKMIGIATDESQVITGAELDELGEKKFAETCSRYKVFARVSPEHKVKIVKAIKAKKKIVAMTGDGVNDAPSLKIADIGVGMGKTGTDVVKNVADMVITDDNFTSIVVAVEEGRKVYSNIQKALQFLISTNCVEVFGMLFALIFFPQYTFLLPVQMLFINLVTDSLPAFALGVEKVEPEVMKSPPRDSHAGLFAFPVGISIIYQSILQTGLIVILFVVGALCYSPDVASTMVFFGIIFMQTLHSVNCKTNGSLFDKKITDNPTFNFCFLLTMLINLIVACSPFLYPLFGLKVLNISQWICVAIVSILIIPLCEVCKLIFINRNEKYIKNAKNSIKKCKN